MTEKSRQAQLGVVLLILSLPGTAGAEVDEPRPPATIAVVPALKPALEHSVFMPVVEHINQTFQRRAELRVPPTFERFAKDIDADLYDYVIPPPHLLGRLTSRGYIVVAADSVTSMTAVIFVRENSDVVQLEELAGRELLFPAEHSTTTAMGKSVLREHGLRSGDGYTAKFLESHDDVILAVLRGQADAGVTPNWALDMLSGAFDGSYRKLAESAGIPGTIVLAAPGIPMSEIEELRAALVGPQIVGKPGIGFRFRVLSDPDLRALLERARAIENGSAGRGDS